MFKTVRILRNTYISYFLSIYLKDSDCALKKEEKKIKYVEMYRQIVNTMIFYI